MALPFSSWKSPTTDLRGIPHAALCPPDRPTPSELLSCRMSRRGPRFGEFPGLVGSLCGWACLAAPPFLAARPPPQSVKACQRGRAGSGGRAGRGLRLAAGDGRACSHVCPKGSLEGGVEGRSGGKMGGRAGQTAPLHPLFLPCRESSFWKCQVLLLVGKE